MQKGFNSDISVRGKVFHIQTEDWGNDNPFLVSRVFCSGAVVKTIKTPYATAVIRGHVSPSEAIRLALQRQHQQVMDGLLSGSL